MWKLEAIVSVKGGSVSMTESGFRKVLIQCRRMWIIWRKRQIHESAKGTDHDSESDRKLSPSALICPFDKKLITFCDSPQLKASIVKAGMGSQKGLQWSEPVLVKDKKWLGKVFWGICLGHWDRHPPDDTPKSSPKAEWKWLRAQWLNDDFTQSG